VNEKNELPDSTTETSRLNLIWSVLVFQGKLVVDGLRDFILVPISLIAALLGLLAGGSKPARYYNLVLAFGRRTERWINLFGRQKGTTSDDLIEPLKKRVFRETESNPLFQKASSAVNRSLDQVNEAVKKTPTEHSSKVEN
jgi:hypothetical protein